MAPSSASALALCFLETRPAGSSTSTLSLVAQIEHRLQLASIWGIKSGSRVLEIGCGQGDSTIVLADAVGPDGRVVAIDPGAGDYGAPFTLAQAQQHISQSPLGPRISFYLSVDPIDYLSTYTGPPYDFVILSHCIYYFEDHNTLPTLVAALAPHCKILCIAEWSLESHAKETIPHVLAALLCTTLESKRKFSSQGNIRTVVSPSQIHTTVARRDNSSFQLKNEMTFGTSHLLKDAYWEVRDLKAKREAEVNTLKENGIDSRELFAVVAMYDALDASVAAADGVIQCMTTWVGVFTRKAR